MPTKSEVIDNLKSITQRISDRVWTISVGVVAASLTYIVQSSRGDEPFLEPHQVALPAALALLALACDLTQYMAANRQNYLLLRRMEAAGLEEAKYDIRDPMRRLRTYAYQAKCWLCIIAVGWIVVLTAVRSFAEFG
jgi:hypothetical protein